MLWELFWIGVAFVLVVCVLAVIGSAQQTRSERRDEPGGWLDDE